MLSNNKITMKISSSSLGLEDFTTNFCEKLNLSIVANVLIPEGI